MPELAEVEYYRKVWDAGLRASIERVALHARTRIYRGEHCRRAITALTGRRLLGSEARAKQMLFRFSRGFWMGIHLGMTGRLHVQPVGYAPAKHDHLVLFQKRRALVLTDARQFGRVRFHEGEDAPPWWTALPPAISSPDFTAAVVRDFCKRRAKLAIKAALLQQERFPGVGNWMADEILWRARIEPRALCGSLSNARTGAVWRETRAVCAAALETVGEDFSDPPAGWFYHARWKATGKCPRCSRALQTGTVGGRTTRWCARCQR